MTESIGAALRRRREQRQLTLQQVSEATRIRGHYLQALENGDLSAMPSAAQARGFLRIYAKFLELDVDALIPAAMAAPPSEIPTAPAKKDEPAQSVTTDEGDPGSKAPGLLWTLRQRLARRLDPGSATTGANDAPAPEREADDKKKASR